MKRPGPKARLKLLCLPKCRFLFTRGRARTRFVATSRYASSFQSFSPFEHVGEDREPVAVPMAPAMFLIKNTARQTPSKLHLREESIPRIISDSSLSMNSGQQLAPRVAVSTRIRIARVIGEIVGFGAQFERSRAWVGSGRDVDTSGIEFGN